MVEGLRQRKKMSEDAGTSQPLLDHDDRPEKEDDTEEMQPLLNRQIIVHPGPFNLQAFLASIFLCFQHIIGAVYSCLSAVLPLPAATPSSLTSMQEHELHRLRALASQRFDPDDLDDQQALRKLWAAAFPDLPCTTLKTAQWKEMGWQGEDPATDFRGSGRLGLHCLLYLAQEHSDDFSRLMLKQDGQRSAWEYPFAVAGLNIVFKLLEVIGLRAAPGSTTHTQLQGVLKGAAGRGFVALLSQESHAFEEVFVAAFDFLDREWLRQRASYMEFGQVLAAVKARLDAALSARPGSIAEFRAKLLGTF